MKLHQHIQKFTASGDEIVQSIIQKFTCIHTRKKELLLGEGERCTDYFYVETGCLRLYFVDEKGAEQTIQFALEGWWLTDLDAFHKNAAAAYSIQVLEGGTVMKINKPALDELMKKYPVLENYFRQVYQRSYSAALYRFKTLRMSKESSYDLFESNYPDFIQRIPQKMLASFLGFTPEYLSELRKRKAGKK
ncbi:Crp/Fnr family transcriptional regulator [Flavihumibacter sp. CACIAM 22H1]|uniref:Crp/Fnr family transcriptional regulator n=1 Tax=Flavihumibacter sp. CACIAM 22H1 TaxID=1812911 RepID=UPI0007A8C2CD|nr:Crp/Fnr family transcriptional regulator [Flavihumibacter sp. CACIAM 22H1]KYP15432.1 MAG: hypothetical protein A1D16_12990 [Flavihumibacter sp. CACIAM 22H1]